MDAFATDDRAGHLARAFARNQAILNLQPTRGMSVQAEALARDRQWSDAAEHFEKAARHESLKTSSHHMGTGTGTTCQFLTRAGDMFMSQKQPRRAEPFYAQAQMQCPQDAPSKRGHWTALAMTGRLAQALPILDAYLKLVPSFIDGHAYRGRMLLELGRHAEARASLQRALEQQPNHPLAIQLMKQLQR